MPEKIICRNCNTQNKAENLFCSSCGKKLTNLDSEKEKKSTFAKITFRLIILIIIFIVVFVGYFFVYPTITYQTPEYIKGKELTKAGLKLRSIEYGREDSVTFSTLDATSLYNKYLINKDLKSKPLNISIMDNNLFALSIKHKLYDSLPIEIPVTLIGRPIFASIDSETNMFCKFKINKILLGNLTIPSNAYNYFISLFKVYYNNRIKVLTSRISDIKIVDQNHFDVLIKTQTDYKSLKEIERLPKTYGIKGL